MILTLKNRFQCMLTLLEEMAQHLEDEGIPRKEREARVKCVELMDMIVGEAEGIELELELS